MSNESHLFSDEIHIEQLEVFSHIGVPEDERANPQKLTVTLSFWPSQPTRELADNIRQTVNYSAVAEETKNFVRDHSVSLIETLADRLAAYLLKTFPIQKVTIEMRKFVLENAKYVSVTVTRSAASISQERADQTLESKL